MKGFSVTFDVVTPESAEHGDFAESGYVIQDVSLRDALAELDADGCHVEADCCPVSLQCPPRWFTAYDTNQGTREYYERGESESRSLHVPDNVTPSSRLRIARLLNCYGIR